MLQRGRRRTRIGALAAGAALALAACGGGSVSEQTEANESEAGSGGGDCGEFNILVHPWVGYTPTPTSSGTSPRRSWAARSTTWSSRRAGRRTRRWPPVTATSSSRSGPTRRSWRPRSTTAPRSTSATWAHVGHHRLVRPRMARRGAPRGPRLGEPQRLRRRVRDLGVRRPGPVPRLGPDLHPVRRGDHQEPRPRLQGRLLRRRDGDRSRRSRRPSRTRSG